MTNFCVQTFLVVCLVLSIVGAALWVCYIFAKGIMMLFPYVFGVIVGSAIYAAFIAWRRNRGH